VLLAKQNAPALLNGCYTFILIWSRTARDCAWISV